MLPLLSETGDVVFSLSDHVAPLIWLLDLRFGGCTATAATPQPPLHGSWVPTSAHEPVIDRNMTVTVYSRQTEAADRFFEYLKSWLKKLGHQEEILIERIAVWLPSDRSLPRKKIAHQ